MAVLICVAVHRFRRGSVEYVVRFGGLAGWPPNISRRYTRLMASIRSMRLRAGLSQKQLAELARVSQPNLSAYESGKRTPQPETIGRIMAALRRRPSEMLAEHRQEALEIAERHRAHNVRVFGSAVRGEDTPASDLDLLVDLEPGATLFDLSELRLDMVELLGVEVDIIPSGATGPVMDRILSEAVPL